MNGEIKNEQNEEIFIQKTGLTYSDSRKVTYSYEEGYQIKYDYNTYVEGNS